MSECDGLIEMIRNHYHGHTFTTSETTRKQWKYRDLHLVQEVERLRKRLAESLTAEEIMQICEGLECLYPDAPSVATQLVGAISLATGDGC